jgi:hypothetical protein
VPSYPTLAHSDSYRASGAFDVVGITLHAILSPRHWWIVI